MTEASPYDPSHCPTCGTRRAWGGMGWQPHPPPMCARRLVEARGALLRLLRDRAHGRACMCPGWPPPPYGPGCGVIVEVRVGTRASVVDRGVPIFDGRLDPVLLSSLKGDDVLCAACALALRAEAGATGCASR